MEAAQVMVTEAKKQRAEVVKARNSYKEGGKKGDGGTEGGGDGGEGGYGGAGGG